MPRQVRRCRALSSQGSNGDRAPTVTAPGHAIRSGAAVRNGGHGPRSATSHGYLRPSDYLRSLGLANVAIATELGVSVPTVGLWRTRFLGGLSWPREAPEGRGQREHRRSPACARRGQRGDHVRLVPGLLRVVHRSNQSRWREREHGFREDSPRLVPAHRARDRLRRRTDRPSYLKCTVLVTPILVCGHSGPFRIPRMRC
jgi:hypothetical protein